MPLLAVPGVLYTLGDVVEALTAKRNQVRGRGGAHARFGPTELRSSYVTRISGNYT